MSEPGRRVLLDERTGRENPVVRLLFALRTAAERAVTAVRGREVEEVYAAGFAGFDRPGFGKIACNLSLRPYGPAR